MAVTAGIAIGGAIIGGIKSLKAHSQAKKDEQEANNLRNPFYKIQDEYFQNKNLAAEQAGQGFSADEKNYLTESGQQGLGSSISSITQGGGNPNDVARLFERYQSGIQSTAAQDAEVHRKNLDYYMNANSELAAQKTIQFGVNEKQPYEAKLKEITERRAADKQNEQEGINTAFGSLVGGATGFQNNSLLKKLLSGTSQSQDPFVSANTRSSVTATPATTPQVQSPADAFGNTIDPTKLPAGIQNN